MIKNMLQIVDTVCTVKNDLFVGYFKEKSLCSSNAFDLFVRFCEKKYIDFSILFYFNHY